MDAGDSRDMLAMSEADSRLDATPLWSDWLRGGLDHPTVPLVQQLRKAVEEPQRCHRNSAETLQ